MIAESNFTQFRCWTLLLLGRKSFGFMEMNFASNLQQEKKLVGMQNGTDGGVSQELIADETFNIKVEWLRFDVLTLIL